MPAIEDEEHQDDDGGIPVRKHMDVSDNSGAIDGILHKQEKRLWKSPQVTAFLHGSRTGIVLLAGSR